MLFGIENTENQNTSLMSRMPGNLNVIVSFLQSLNESQSNCLVTLNDKNRKKTSLLPVKNWNNLAFRMWYNFFSDQKPNWHSICFQRKVFDFNCFCVQCLKIIRIRRMNLLLLHPMKLYMIHSELKVEVGLQLEFEKQFHSESTQRLRFLFGRGCKQKPNVVF